MKTRMNNLSKWGLAVGIASLSLTACKEEIIGEKTAPQSVRPSLDETIALREAEDLMETAAKEAGTSRESLANARRTRFTREQNVFFPGTLAIDFEKRTATLPLYKGIGPSGRPTYYIVTEAANFYVAKLLGINYAPKLVFGRDTEGSQEVTLTRGYLQFKGDVDFSPQRTLVAGIAATFPPSVAQPGAVADDAYSPLVVLPSGSVLNAQIVANSTGMHDRAVAIDYRKGTITLQILDGFQGGDQFYFHLVTDSSDPVAATIELGVYAPRLANLPTFGQSTEFDASALLGFSPASNGETGADNPQRQGLNSTIVDGDRDPINVFPLDPDNSKQFGNNYSPMWDAHVSAWTEEAIAAGKRRRITGFEDLQALVEAGLVTSFAGNSGEPNGFVAGLKPTNLIINCPVIAQPLRTYPGYADIE
ncbi:MAG: hypothetical protein H7Z75_02700 [Ferruginibacter sp.]|nr:hypothetical protein [Cytophagales bacterium]